MTETVRMFREARRLTYAELSRQLGDLGRDIAPLGLRRIEAGERRVDVDDLVALAMALGVSPLALLLPTESSSVVPEGNSFPAERIWTWATGSKVLQDGLGEAESFRFMHDSNPLLDWSKVLGLTEDQVSLLGDFKDRLDSMNPESSDGNDQ